MKKPKSRREQIEQEIEDLHDEIAEAEEAVGELEDELKELDRVEEAEARGRKAVEHSGRTYAESERLICTDWFTGCPCCALEFARAPDLGCC